MPCDLSQLADWSGIGPKIDVAISGIAMVTTGSTTARGWSIALLYIAIGQTV